MLIYYPANDEITWLFQWIFISMNSFKFLNIENVLPLHKYTIAHDSISSQKLPPTEEATHDTITIMHINHLPEQIRTQTTKF